jgi:ParB family chromosome partitioning protein
MALFRKEKEGLLWLEPSAILPANGQPRTIFKEAPLQELAQSIAAHGVLQPLVVLEEGEHYRLIAGERRLRAAQMAGLKQVPCVLTEKTPEEAAKLSLIENLQREDLSFFEEAAAYRRLMQDYSLSQAQIAREMSKDPSTIANKLRLLKLPLCAQLLIHQNGLTERHARAFLRISDAERLMELLEQVIDDALNVKETEQLIAKELAPPKEKPPKRQHWAIKDIRLCINTLNHTVQTLKQAGIKPETEIIDGERLVEYIVRIPKTS